MARGRVSTVVEKIPHTMATFQTTAFKVSDNSPIGSLRVLTGCGGIAPFSCAFHDRKHVFGIGLPVGGQVQ